MDLARALPSRLSLPVRLVLVVAGLTSLWALSLSGQTSVRPARAEQGLETSIVQIASPRFT